jgi:hypothetical protein
MGGSDFRARIDSGIERKEAGQEVTEKKRQ